MINVLWLSYYPNVPAKYYWDQGAAINLFARLGYRDVFDLADIPPGEGAIVCLPAKAHEADIPRLNADLARMPWVLAILAEDEGGDFDTDLLEHPNMRVWVQTPWPGRYQRVDHALPVYYRVECEDEMARHRQEKSLDWAFCGQVTHQRRRSCAKALEGLANGHSTQTQVFGARPDEGGLSYPDYCALLASAKVIPCPSGNVNVDSFRVWETLQSGGVPVVDGLSPRPDFPGDYWERVAPGAPWPVIYDWSTFPTLLADILEDWRAHAARCGAWWLAHKRRLRVLLEDTLRELGAVLPARERFTVLIPTSPIPDHPSTAHLVETVNSIRARTSAEIIISCDGVRPEQADLRERYIEYVRDVLWHAQHVWQDVLVVVHEEHLHQVEMARRALPLVRTEAILYVEHDTPLIGDIPWDGLVGALCEFDVIRLYHELQIPEEHGYLHRGQVEFGSGLRFRQTVQWSQRPHLACTEWYGEMLARYFSGGARTFIEDKMHGVAQAAAWDGRLAIYAPPGDDIRRSYHTDGRRQGPKFDTELIF